MNIEQTRKAHKNSFYYKSFICKVNLGQGQILGQGQNLGQGQCVSMPVCVVASGFARCLC